MYNPSDHKPQNIPFGITDLPLNAKSLYYDNARQLYRQFVSVSECQNYFADEFKDPTFECIVNTGGVLGSDGRITGGINDAYWFRDSVTLEKKVSNGYSQDDINSLISVLNGQLDVISGQLAEETSNRLSADGALTSQIGDLTETVQDTLYYWTDIVTATEGQTLFVFPSLIGRFVDHVIINKSVIYIDNDTNTASEIDGTLNFDLATGTITLPTPLGAGDRIIAKYKNAGSSAIIPATIVSKAQFDALAAVIADVSVIDYVAPLPFRAYTAAGVYQENYSSVTQTDLGSSVDFGRSSGDVNICLYYRTGKNVSSFPITPDINLDTVMVTDSFIRSIVTGNASMGIGCLPSDGDGVPFGYVYRIDGSIFKQKNYSEQTVLATAPTYVPVTDIIRFELIFKTVQILNIYKNGSLVASFSLPENLRGEYCVIERGRFLANHGKESFTTTKIVAKSDYVSKMKTVDTALSVRPTNGDLFDAEYTPTGSNLITEAITGYYSSSSGTVQSSSSTSHSNFIDAAPGEAFNLTGFVSINVTPSILGKVFNSSNVAIGNLLLSDFPLENGAYTPVIPLSLNTAAKVVFNFKNADAATASAKRTTVSYGKIKESLYDAPESVVPNNSGGTLLLDEKFTESTIPSNFVNTDWVKVTGGIKASTAGLANLIIHRLDYNLAVRKYQIPFVLGANVTGAILNRSNPAGGNLNTLNGAMVSVSSLNNNVVIHNGNDGSNTSKGALITTPYTFVSGRKYIFDLAINMFQQSYTVNIYDTLTGVKTFIGTDQSNVRVWLDNIAFATLSGTDFTISGIRISTEIEAGGLVYFLGDSITQSTTVPLGPGEGWAYILASRIGQNSTVSGRNGGDVNSGLNRVATEVSKLKPKYVDAMIWTNGEVSEVEANLPLLYNAIVAAGSIPIFNNAPMRSTDAVAKNAVIEAFRATKPGLNGMKMQIATSINNDPAQGTNLSVYIDGTHPNAAGNILMANRAEIDTPELFN